MTVADVLADILRTDLPATAGLSGLKPLPPPPQETRLLGQRTVWVGPIGAGSRLKLVNNTWVVFAAEAAASSVAHSSPLGA